MREKSRKDIVASMSGYFACRVWTVGVLQNQLVNSVAAAAGELIAN